MKGILFRLATIATVGLALGALMRKANRFDLRGKTAIVTGGSRGLGLLLARRLAERGANVAILARDAAELERALVDLEGCGAPVLGIECDIRIRGEVARAVGEVVERFGTVDVLINNAGIIQVGPLENQSVEDFHEAMAVHFFGPLYAITAALPYLKKPGGARIVNISSIGGKIAIPHLVPYCASKFALTGLSDGIRAELQSHGILVTTVCPGLMRTGSPRNATFKGRHREEFSWFAISDSLPGLTMDADRAADRIVDALVRGAPRLDIPSVTRAATLADAFAPGLMARVMALVNGLLPKALPEAGTSSYKGYESESSWAPSPLTRLSDEAAARNNE